VSAAKRYNDYGVLIYVDLDNFKPINDTYGHAAGDEVLRHVARILQEHVRDFDTVGRLGGDEFTVLLSRTSFDGGLKRAEALDRILNSSFIHWNGRIIRINASLGVLVFGPEESDPIDLLNRADSAMYKNKRMRSHMSKRLAIA
ncbi:MAG: GGDEF domain-containing protein, partial [Rhodospirillales bacterium]|nr:GGDEF domain-containing protein [Rhodospirillales bacterium]